MELFLYLHEYTTLMPSSTPTSSMTQLVPTWQAELKQVLSTSEECNTYLGTQMFTEQDFSLKIPRTYADLIDRSNPTDPLLLQVLHQDSTTKQSALFSKQPIIEAPYNTTAGIVHKYKNRVLLITTADCAIHCSYCFRQHFSYEKNTIFHDFAAVISYLQADTQVNEVILSGGDPLNIDNKKLARIFRAIEGISHIDTIRIHSRTVVVLNRLDTECIKLINNSSVQVVLVTHINHPREITPYLVQAMSQLDALVLNQSVLLRGVNDSADILRELSQSLFNIGILPYYLNMLDLVSGSEQFFVDDARAKELYTTLQETLSGYLVPKLVRDENKKYKTIL